MLARACESVESLFLFENDDGCLERALTDPIDRKAWLTISLVAFRVVVDEYRQVVGFDNFLRLRLKVREAFGTALETGLATARTANPRHDAESMVSGDASTQLTRWWAERSMGW